MELKGLVIGGLLPALAFGVTGVLQKLAMRTGIGLGPYLLCIGVGVVLAGTLMTVLWPTTQPGAPRFAGTGAGAAALSGAVGLSWAVGMALVAAGIGTYGVPLAKLAPLYNLNTLVVVLLALVIFAEFREVAPLKLLGGTALMLAGAWLVGRS